MSPIEHCVYIYLVAIHILVCILAYSTVSANCTNYRRTAECSGCAEEHRVRYILEDPEHSRARDPDPVEISRSGRNIRIRILRKFQFFNFYTKCLTFSRNHTLLMNHNCTLLTAEHTFGFS